MNDPSTALPETLPGPTSNLNARIPSDLHLRFKVATTVRGRKIAHVVEDLVGIYLSNPELIDRLAEVSKRHGQTLGDTVVQAINRAIEERG